MATFPLSIVTPSGAVLEDEVAGLVAPGTEGEFGVLAHHAPMIAAIRRGCLKVRRKDEQVAFFAVHEGFVRVDRDQVVVLTAQACAATDPEDARRRAQAFAVVPPA